MNNPPSGDHYQQTFPFAPFGSGAGSASVLKTKVLRLTARTLRRIWRSFRKANRAAVEKTVVEPVILSRYEVDDFGRPRVISKFEATLYALARPVVFGVVLGFGLAASLLAVHNASTLPPQIKKSSPPRMASLEAKP